jgi:SAM-dependent methyltransferase
MMNELKKKYERDRRTWDECAETYETHIVGGHPDILAFEEFEEDMLDRMLRFLVDTQGRPLKLMDIGCGSGRLHVRYGLKTAAGEDAEQLRAQVSQEGSESAATYDPVIAGGLAEVWGIDFSQCMIDLAEEKLARLGLDSSAAIKLTLEQGSAFEMKPQPDDVLPIAICLVNSIGVMQGFEGAAALFASMRRTVEPAGGIAIVSCYQKEYVGSYALGQYESTMDVSGQPWWLVPDTYASAEYKQIPRRYKLAHSPDDTIVVDVLDTDGTLVKKGHLLRRDPAKTEETMRTGDITTFSDYRSHWYSFDEIERLIGEHWKDVKTFHVETGALDMLRAEAAQMAILDAGDRLKNLLARWSVS